MPEAKLVARWELVYRCPFCRRRWRRRRRDAALAHLIGCLERPDRRPLAGELTTTIQAGRLVVLKPMGNGDIEERPHREGRALPSGAWVEWVPREMTAWWPGPGKIWDGLAWRPVPGWSQAPTAEGDAHGLVGHAPPVDVWPLVEGVPFDKLVRSDRLLAFLQGRVGLPPRPTEARGSPRSRAR
jgi:hypothetical protein